MRRTDEWITAQSVHEALVFHVDRMNIAANGMSPSQAFHVLGERALPDIASKARNLAVSYRNFRVGIGALAATIDPNTYTLLRAANSKPDEETLKYCGEMAIEETIENSPDLVSLIGIVIVAATNRDHGSGLEFSTLDCCEGCRHMFACVPEIVPSDMPIVSYNPERRTVRTRTPQELFEVHGNPDMSATPHYLLAREQRAHPQALQTIDFGARAQSLAELVPA